MRIIEHLSSLSPAMRELSALRWGVPSGSPRLMAESLFAASVRDQLFERIGADGAAPLYLRLIEAGGVPMRPEPGMEEMAARLGNRSLLVSTPEGIALPEELVVLEQGRAELEQGWSLTLLARCDLASLRALALAAGLPHRSRRVALVVALHRWLRDAPQDGLETVAQATLKCMPVAASALVSVSVRPFGNRAIFEVATDAGPLEVVAREVAHSVLPKPERVKKKAAPERVSPFAFPEHGEAGALLLVSSRSLADRIAAEERLAGFLVKRLDGRRFLAPPEVSSEELEARLAELLAGIEVVHG